MKIALIGYGKMGRMIEQTARSRGHEIVCIIDVDNQQDFDNLLSELSKIEGTFLLSSFRNKSLTEFSSKNGWYQIELKMAKPMTSQLGKTVSKIEVLTANYPIGIVEGNVKRL